LLAQLENSRCTELSLAFYARDINSCNAFVDVDADASATIINARNSSVTIINCNTYK
jgi:hypothetical protein